VDEWKRASPLDDENKFVDQFAEIDTNYHLRLLLPLSAISADIPSKAQLTSAIQTLIYQVREQRLALWMQEFTYLTGKIHKEADLIGWWRNHVMFSEEMTNVKKEGQDALQDMQKFKNFAQHATEFTERTLQQLKTREEFRAKHPMTRQERLDRLAKRLKTR
jgi:hypothetical protein